MEKLSVTEQDERVEKHADLIIEGKRTVREVSKITKWSRTTVDVDITKRLPDINLQKAAQVRVILDQNYSERNIRGGRVSGHKKKGTTLK